MNMKQLINKLNEIKNEVKTKIKEISKEDTGQGAAEYILLFGGVIVIAIAALFIYNSYFANGQTSLNASSDINDVRDAMGSI